MANDPGGEQRPSVQAAFQVTEQTRTYPCPACGGQLAFDIASQKLKCPSCGNTTDIPVDTARVMVDHDLSATMADLRIRQQEHQAPVVSGEKEIVCQNCGGHSTFVGSLTATRCPYCATPIQRDDVADAPSRLAVDGVLPFQVDEKKGRAVLEEWINGRWFAPAEFKKYKQTGAFTSLYAAYFTYDASTTSSYTGQRGEHYTVTVGSGDNRHTETRTRWYPASGRVRNIFDDVAVLANEGLDRGHITELEPWPTAEAKPYEPQYVAGHLCRTYDHDAEEAFPEARERMDEAIADTIRDDIGGDEQRITSVNTAFHALTFRHLLLPIWLLTVIYEQRPFQVFINGMTGEVQGQRPWSKVKIAAAIIAGLIVAIIAIYLYQSAKSGSA